MLGPKHKAHKVSDRFHTWQSQHAVGDDTVFISRADEQYEAGEYQVAVVGWDQRGAPGRDGSEWTLTLDIVPAFRTNTPVQKKALEEVYNACCGGTNACKAWREKGGAAADACHLRGNLCDAAGNVTHLNFVNFNLQCELPIAKLAPVLSTVKRLEMGGNPSLTGRGASTFEALFAASSSMTHFHAEGTSLTALDSGAAQQTFTPAVCLSFPASLVSIRLKMAGIKGPLDPCLIAHNLHEIQLQDNELTGSLPPLPLGSSLRVLYLHNNTLNGPVPPSYASNAVNLSSFSAGQNKLTGQLPSFAQQTLHELLMGRNSLTGVIPASVTTLDGLIGLDLSYNGLSGNIPDALLAGPSRQYVLLHNNALTGQLPTATVGENVYYVDFGSNLLSGPVLPLALLRAPNLMHLNLEDNLLDGTLPRITTTPGLNTMPSYLRAARQVLLARNRISGSIPADFAKLPVFTATPSMVLTQAGWRVYLHVLDVSGNMLTGTAPNWIGTADKSSVYINVDISGNRFDCPIPKELAYMSLGCVKPDGKIGGTRDGSIQGAAGTNLDNSEGHSGSGGDEGRDRFAAAGGVTGVSALGAFLFVFLIGMFYMTAGWVRRRRLRASHLRRFTNMTTELSDLSPSRPSQQPAPQGSTHEGVPVANVEAMEAFPGETTARGATLLPLAHEPSVRGRFESERAGAPIAAVNQASMPRESYG